MAGGGVLAPHDQRVLVLGRVPAPAPQHRLVEVRPRGADGQDHRRPLLALGQQDDLVHLPVDAAGFVDQGEGVVQPSSRFGTAGRTWKADPRDGTVRASAYCWTRASSSSWSSTMRTAIRNVRPACRSSVATTIWAPSGPTSSSYRASTAVRLVLSCPRGSIQPASRGWGSHPRWRRSGTAARAATATAYGHHGHAAPERSRWRTVPPPAPAAWSRAAATESHQCGPSGLASRHHRPSPAPSRSPMSRSPARGSGPSILLKDRNPTADLAALQGTQRTTSGPSSGPPRRTSQT
jgi:hypothetical protein